MGRFSTFLIISPKGLGVQCSLCLNKRNRGYSLSLNRQYFFNLIEIFLITDSNLTVPSPVRQSLLSHYITHKSVWIRTAVAVLTFSLVMLVGSIQTPPVVPDLVNGSCFVHLFTLVWTTCFEPSMCRKNIFLKLERNNWTKGLHG